MKEEPRLCADEKGAARRPTGNKSTSVPGGRKRSLPSAEGPERPGLRGWRGKNKIDAHLEAWTGGRGEEKEGEREGESDVGQRRAKRDNKGTRPAEKSNRNKR